MAGRAGGEAVNWIKTAKHTYALERNMGAVWETLHSGWLPVVTVNGIATKLEYAPTQEEARKRVEDYWEAAWALKPEN